MAKRKEYEPFVWLVTGRRGTGKSYLLQQLIIDWKKNHREDSRSKVYVVDPVSTNPPSEKHVAFTSDYWASDIPEDISQFPEDVGLLVIDEADIAIPQSDAHRRPITPGQQILKRGRHEGIALILATQAPAMIAYNAWRLADRVWILRLTSRSDLSRIEELPGIESEHIEAVRARKSYGPAVVWDADEEEPTVFIDE